MKRALTLTLYALACLTVLCTAQTTVAQRGGAPAGIPGVYRASVEPH